MTAVANVSDTMTGEPALAAAQGRLRRWLFDAAFPLWSTAGVDRVHGGFHDKLTRAGDAVLGPRRVRVQARQVFVFAEAGRLGWDGPWRECVQEGLDILPAFARDDGFLRASIDDDGRPVVDEADLYDQAFVLFALAAAYAETGRPTALRRQAEALLDRLDRQLKHPVAGYEEASPRRLPLRSNPHMHLLEALLAWIEAGERGLFETRAREIASLARTRLIDPSTGAVGEYYDGGWGFAEGAQGRLREPGHQFEWAYLLDRCGQSLGDDHGTAIAGLVRFGETFGVRDGRAVFALNADGGLIDGASRLWAQSERLRTMLMLGDRRPPGIEPHTLHTAALESLATLERFLDVPVRGLWRERTDAAGEWLDEPVPASSLYHIVTGIMPLVDRPMPDHG